MGFAALIVIVGVVVVGLLHSAKFHGYLLRTAQEKATQALGSRVQLADFTLGWSGYGPTVDLQNLVVHGSSAHEDTPLLRVDSLHAQITIQSLWHRSWYLDDVRIEHPVVHFLADNQGRTNLPQPQSQGNSHSQMNVFALGIRHLLLERGEVYYNNHENDLAGDVHDLRFQSSFDPSGKRYSGNLSYRNGHIQWQSSNPVAHSLDARFAATPEQFTLQSAVLTTPGSHLSLEAVVRNYSQPIVHATYQAVVDSGEFRRALNNPTIPAGRVSASGVIDYKSNPERPLLAAVNLQGAMHSAELTVSQGNGSLPIRGLAAEYSLTNGNARVSGIRAEVLGGNLAGRLAILDLTGAARSNLEMSLKSVSASALQERFGPRSADHAAIGGFLNANAHATWGKSLNNLSGQAEISLHASMKPPSGGSATPVNGLIHASYDAARQMLSLRRSYLRTPQMSVAFNGTISDRSSLQVRVQSDQLHEVEQLADAFLPAGSAPLGLYGKATAAATIRGSTRDPNIRGQLTATDVRLKGTSWQSLRTEFAANRSAVRLDGGELVSANKGHITFQLGATLQDWAFSESSPFHIQFSASGLSAKDIAQAAGVSAQVDGMLSVKAEFNGTKLAPVGRGQIRLAHARVADEPVDTANLDFEADGNAITARLKTDLPAGSATANVRYEPRQKKYDAEIRALGIKLAQLETFKSRNLQLAGALNMTATGSGTVQDPSLVASIEVPQLQVRGQEIKYLKCNAKIAQHVAKLEFTSQVLGSQANGHGTIELRDDYPVDIAFDTQVIPLQAVLAMYAPSQAATLTGQTELHATLRGPLERPGQLDIQLVVPQFSVKYKTSIQLAATAPIHAHYTHGVLEVNRFVMKGTGTDLTFQASLPAAKDAHASILLQGTVDLQLAELFDPDVTSGGQVRFDINSFGQRSSPEVQGKIHIANASFARTGTPLGLRDGNGVITLTRNRLDITEFQGKVGGGTVTAHGGVVYRPDVQFDLAMKAEEVRVLYQQSIRATLNSTLALTGHYDSALLRGQVGVEQLSLTSNTDLMEIVGNLGGAPAPPPTGGGFADNLRLQVAVQTPSGVNLSSRDLSVAGSANLQVRGSAAQPVIVGRINLTDGDLIFSGNRYLVQSGTIDFRNSLRTEAVVNLAVNTTIDQYNIQLHLWGPVDHMHTNYSSDPALPPADIINLIAFGKTSEAAAANPAPGTLGAQSLVASQVSSQVTSRIEKLAGISQLSIDPVLGGGQQSPGARIAIKQKVTSKIFVTYATDVTSTQQQAIEVEYQLNRRVSLNAVRNQNGGFSFETTIRKEW